MKTRFTAWMKCATLAGGLLISASAFTAEKLDRGLIALEREDGSVYIGWRAFPTDAPTTAFMLTRIEVGKVEPALAKKPKWSTRGTNEIDKNADKGKTYRYELAKISLGGSGKPVGEVTIKVTGNPTGYIRIPLQGNYDFQKVGIADLDGDGQYEYIIKQPDFNTDPYQQPGYWKKSPTTYKLEAYEQDGTHLWTYDMGWSIEAGIWYSPWIVYDVDGDGKAEVYAKAGEGDPRDADGRVTSGPEYLVKIDGQTGKVVARTDWLSREGYEDYNYYCRNFLTVAYLDGKTPSLIMQRGTYTLIKILALDKDFKKVWYWDATGDYAGYKGQSSHGLIAADVDRDGRDELVVGAAIIDDNGKGLWSLGMGHPDVCYVADIDPDHPGLEIFYGFETKQQKDGLCLVDAKTGRKLWGHKEPTQHVHDQGMVGDILSEYPGMEVFAGERDYPQRWLYSAQGKLIETVEGGSLNPRPVWWDDDPQKEVTTGKAIRKWKGKVLQPIEGEVIAVVDCLGDAREEVITAKEGEMRIYSTTLPTSQRRPCLMLNHQYRLGVVAQTMGYYYPAQLGE